MLEEQEIVSYIIHLYLSPEFLFTDKSVVFAD